MNHISIREATAQDASVIAGFLQLMLEEMVSVGGHEVLRSEREWARIEQRIRDAIGEKDHVYLLVRLADPQVTPIGFAEARVVNTAPVFQPKRILHSLFDNFMLILGISV
jgi:hypothetical protein